MERKVEEIIGLLEGLIALLERKMKVLEDEELAMWQKEHHSLLEERASILRCLDITDQGKITVERLSTKMAQEGDRFASEDGCVKGKAVVDEDWVEVGSK